MNAAGETTTDYSYQFSKRFLNDRVRFVIGGKVSSSADATEATQSFIDNIAIEYRLDAANNRYVRLFYDRNSYDALEGTLMKTGAGFVMRRKADRFSDLFLIRRKKKSTTENQKANEAPPIPPRSTPCPPRSPTLCELFAHRESTQHGEQLYTGIRDVNYTLDTPLSKQRNTATADSAGVITSIANAVDAVERAMKGGGHATPSLDELRRQHWDSLTSAQRKRLLTQEKNERTNIANTKTEIDAVLAYPPNGALFGSTKYTTPWKFGLLDIQ